MPKLKHTEMRLIDIVLEMSDGYVLDFSNKTIAIFFDEECAIDLYSDKYSFNGESKAKYVRAFIEVESGPVVASVLSKLWSHKESLSGYSDVDSKDIKDRLFSLIASLASGCVNVAVTALDTKAKLLNLDTVSRDLDRALKASDADPESALTSACSTLESVCRSILIELNDELPKNKDLISLYKAVRRPLGLTPDISVFPKDISNDVLKILTGLTTVVEGIASLRTHGGDAHGREKGYSRVDTRIASLSVHAASSASIFLLETWQKKFPGKTLKLSS